MAKEFSYSIQKGQQVYDDPTARQKFLISKPDGHRGFEAHRKPSKAKSNPQLGYYWGLLVPEIRKQLTQDGWTITMNGPRELQRYYTNNDVHDWLKGYCAKLGPDGVHITLSEQDQEICSKYLDNVLWVAEYWLKMDRQALEAKKPKLKGD